MPTKVYGLSDRATGGRLAYLLRKWREDGLSHELIARKLENEHGIVVSGRTVGNWLAELGETGGKAKASA
jgi:hypothetical protein